MTESEEEEERELIRDIFDAWECACADEEEAASIVSFREEELKEYNIDPNNPPEWLLE